MNEGLIRSNLNWTSQTKSWLVGAARFEHTTFAAGCSRPARPSSGTSPVAKYHMIHSGFSDVADLRLDPRSYEGSPSSRSRHVQQMTCSGAGVFSSNLSSH